MATGFPTSSPNGLKLKMFDIHSHKSLHLSLYLCFSPFIQTFIHDLSKNPPAFRSNISTSLFDILSLRLYSYINNSGKVQWEQDTQAMEKKKRRFKIKDSSQFSWQFILNYRET